MATIQIPSWRLHGPGDCRQPVLVLGVGVLQCNQAGSGSSSTSAFQVEWLWLRLDSPGARGVRLDPRTQLGNIAAPEETQAGIRLRQQGEVFDWLARADRLRSMNS